MKALIIYDETTGTIYNTIYGGDGLKIATMEADLSAGTVPERVDISGQKPDLCCYEDTGMAKMVAAVLEEDRWKELVAMVKTRTAAGEDLQKVIASLDDLTNAEMWKLEAEVRDNGWKE